MMDITLDSVESELKFQEVEKGKTLYIYELGETEDRTKAVVITAPYQIVFVDTLPVGRGPEDYLIIRDLTVLVDSRKMNGDTEQAQAMKDYLAWDLANVKTARRLRAEAGRKDSLKVK